MRFRVGPWTYRIRISEGQLRDSRGVAVDGLCCWSDRTIWINGVLPLQQRIDVLLHELSHAWEEHFGRPGDSEGICNQQASFTTDVWRQFERQGGADRLMRLRVDGVADDQLSEESENTAYAVECGGCRSKVAVGSVKTFTPRFSVLHGKIVVDRVAACEDCGANTCWVEGTTTTGRPNGVVLDGPNVSHLRSSIVA